MTLTIETEQQLNAICKGLQPKQAHYLRSWLITVNRPLSMFATGVTSDELEAWKDDPAFAEARQQIRKLSARTYQRLVSASMLLADRMSDEEKKKHEQVLDPNLSDDELTEVITEHVARRI